MTYHQQSETPKDRWHTPKRRGGEATDRPCNVDWNGIHLTTSKWQLAILNSRAHILTHSLTRSLGKHGRKHAITCGLQLLWFDKLWLLAHIYDAFYSLWMCASRHQQIHSIARSLSASFRRFLSSMQWSIYPPLFVLFRKQVAFPHSLSMNIWFACICNYKSHIHALAHPLRNNVWKSSSDYRNEHACRTYLRSPVYQQCA